MQRIAAASLVTCLALMPMACSDGEAGEDANAPARRAVLASIGQNAVLPTYRDFETATGELVAATSAYAASLDPEDLTAARDAWAAAIDIWQRAELMQFGPAGSTGAVGTPGGRDLRDHIYSWPNANPCRVDQETFERTYEDPTLLQAETVDAKGLDALEYLLFHEGSDNACPSLSTINESGNWDALSAEQKLQRRADYAEAASGLVHGRAQELLGAWEPEGENFLHELSEAGLESTVYGTSQEALNAVSDGLFYVDTDTKDMKVGEPAGIVDCLNEVCPAALESDFARRSKEHVLNNLHGFALVFRGGPGDEPTSEGIDDLLTDLGPDAATLATQMNTELDEAIAAVEAVDGTFYDALTTDPTPVRTAHEAIRDLTTLYKSQFLALLDLSPPASAPADND